MAGYSYHRLEEGEGRFDNQFANQTDFRSIFKYSDPSMLGGSGETRFVEYWRKRENVKSSSKTTSNSGLQLIAISIFFGLSWIFWLIFLPFHAFWTVKRVKNAESLVIFRAGEPPFLRSRQGSFVFLWPLGFDTCFRVSHGRRGFSVPPSQIGLSDESVVRFGAEFSFHVDDAVRYVRIARDTNTSLRHIVHGLMITTAGRFTLENFQRYSSAIQAELKNELANKLRQTGVVVDSFAFSALTVIKEPSDPGRELIASIIKAIGGQQQPCTLPTAVDQPPKVGAGDSKQADACVESANAAQMTDLIKWHLSSLWFTNPDAKRLEIYQLRVGRMLWTIRLADGQVDGPVKQPENQEHDIPGLTGSISIVDWETLNALRTSTLSPTAAFLAGRLSTKGDLSTLLNIMPQILSNDSGPSGSTP